ncbi:MAG: AAA family ATPase [Gimesia sp.]|nr:AAA family ATPase [Gimesia sp.]
MNIRNRLIEYIRACFTGIWIESYEHQEALTEIAALCRDEQWQLATWDIDAGLKIPGQPEPEASGSDPLAAIRAVNALATPDGTAIIVLQNFHRFMQSAEVVQALSRQINAGKQNRSIVMVLAPVVQIPTELEKMFVVVEHELPDRGQLEEIARGIATEAGELPEGNAFQLVLDASAGLTRMEAENAFSLSLVRQGRITADAVWELKTQALKKSGLLSLYRGEDDFSHLGGLTALKTFCRRALRKPSRDDPRKRPRGVLLLSPPGCGKSQFCKALGQEVGRPVLNLDVGNLLGSLVGQSEERTRQALRVIEAMAPCVAMIDEVEKAFSGLNGSGDSGVSSRMFGTFLSWLADHQSDVFVVCTANDVSKLPPEFGRSERFDGIFFLDLPGREQKNQIWEQYIRLFGLNPEQERPEDTDWTGAEIRSCCRLAGLLDVTLLESRLNVVPIAVTAAESVEQLRTWANGRCLDADRPGIFHWESPRRTSRRSIKHLSSIN